MVLYGAMETYQPRPLWNTGLHTAIQGYILIYRVVYWITGVDTRTGVAPLGPEDTKGATVYGEMKTYQSHPFWNTGLHTAIQGYITNYRGEYKDRIGTLGPEDTNGAIWSNGNIPAASPLEYRATYRNGIDILYIHPCSP